VVYLSQVRQPQEAKMQREARVEFTGCGENVICSTCPHNTARCSTGEDSDFSYDCSDLVSVAVYTNGIAAIVECRTGE
jgi:hypothetical protein